jgi:hypothetical protein
MLISKLVIIDITTLSSKTISLYNNRYNLNRTDDNFIEVPIEVLAKTSHIMVYVQCDYCYKKYNITYKAYNTSKKNINKLSCNDKECINEKKKDVFIHKYGVNHYSKTSEYNTKVKKTSVYKYGVEHYSKTDEYKDKIKETCLEKYGIDNYSKTSEYKDKIKETCLEKYGVEHYSKTDEYKDKMRETCLDRYGVDNYTKTDKYKQSYKKTCLKSYGVNHYSKSEEYHINSKIGNDINYIMYLNDTISLLNCGKGHTFEIHNDNYVKRVKSNIPLCTICYPIGDQKSIKEKELLEYIKSIYSGEIISGYRDGLEIDIYLPELNIGFEFNGLYYHSSKFKDKNYHLNKTNHFKEKGIRIIHIWEDDWGLRKEIVKSQISNLLKINTEKIFARKCLVKQVSIKDCKKFLDDNHIQGKVNSSLKLGLYFNEELVSLMTFDHNEGRKKMELGGWNLNRFCNKTVFNVIGGASKLLRYFIKNYDVKRIVSYADKDWSLGNLYDVLGFTNVGGNGPDYKYIVDNQRVHKSRYKKSKLKTELTESQEMSKREIYKIYDCGKLKFELKIN